MDTDEEITLDEEFEKWLHIKCDKIKYENILITLKHFRKNNLVAELKIDTNYGEHKYSVIIKGEEDVDGISFDFYRHKEAQWRFGIDIDDTSIKNGLSLKGYGYSRFMMTIMLYCLDKYIDKPIDLKLPGDHLTIGICADASDGFWTHMKMKMGRLSMDGNRYKSKVGSNCGYDLEFTMYDWKRWVFSDIDVKQRPDVKKKRPKSSSSSSSGKRQKTSGSKKVKKTKKKKKKKEKEKKTRIKNIKEDKLMNLLKDY